MLQLYIGQTVSSDTDYGRVAAEGFCTERIHPENVIFHKGASLLNSRKGYCGHLMG
jgi:hypothetical protein